VVQLQVVHLLEWRRPTRVQDVCALARRRTAALAIEALRAAAAAAAAA